MCALVFALFFRVVLWVQCEFVGRIDLSVSQLAELSKDVQKGVVSGAGQRNATTVQKVQLKNRDGACEKSRESLRLFQKRSFDGGANTYLVCHACRGSAKSKRMADITTKGVLWALETLIAKNGCRSFVLHRHLKTTALGIFLANHVPPALLLFLTISFRPLRWSRH